MIWPCRSANLEGCDGEEAKVAPIRAVFQEAQRVSANKDDEQGAVGSRGAEQGAFDVVFDCEAGLALAKYFGAKAVVCEALCRIEHNVAHRFQVHEVGVCLVPVYACARLVWVEFDGEAAEARIYAGFTNVERDAELGICVGGALEVEVDFVDGEGKVGEVDGHEHISPVLYKVGTAWLRLRIAGAYEDAI